MVGHYLHLFVDIHQNQCSEYFRSKPKINNRSNKFQYTPNYCILFFLKEHRKREEEEDKGEKGEERDVVKEEWEKEEAREKHYSILLSLCLSV